MQQLTVKEIVEATGGTLLGGNMDTVLTDITTDSRCADSGMLFIPLAGETFDGHEFINAAFDCGASAVLTHKDIDVLVNKTIIRVKDTFRALADIARYYKAKHRIPTVAVTGSVGKTTTKDMLYSVLAKKYCTLKTQGNFNNEIGLPLTVFRQEEDHEMEVLEMGQSGFGEIHNLASVAKPDVAVITNIGMAHIEKLGSQEGIFKAKMEITDFFTDKNILIINGDDPFLNTVAERPYTVIRYGISNPACDVRAYDIEDMGADGSRFHIDTEGKTYTCRVRTAGVHNVYNALAAICVGRLYCVSMEDILDGIEHVELTAMRMAIEQYSGITVINDCYNASPDSVRAALSVLDSVEAKRKIAVLGDILEMGSYAKDAHCRLGKDAAEYKIDILITAGEYAQYLAQGAKENGAVCVVPFAKTREAARFVHDTVKDGDAVLVKASRGMRFEWIVDAIKERSKEE